MASPRFQQSASTAHKEIQCLVSWAAASSGSAEAPPERRIGTSAGLRVQNGR